MSAVISDFSTFKWLSVTIFLVFLTTHQASPTGVLFRKYTCSATCVATPTNTMVVTTLVPSKVACAAQCTGLCQGFTIETLHAAAGVTKACTLLTEPRDIPCPPPSSSSDGTGDVEIYVDIDHFPSDDTDLGCQQEGRSEIETRSMVPQILFFMYVGVSVCVFYILLWQKRLNFSTGKAGPLKIKIGCTREQTHNSRE